ncbi:hypothetical protein LL947_10015 [Halomonas sp. BLK-85]
MIDAIHRFLVPARCIVGTAARLRRVGGLLREATLRNTHGSSCAARLRRVGGLLREATLGGCGRSDLGSLLGVV